MSLFNLSKPTKSIGQAKVLAVLNQKGGVGKTTLSFNLAHALKAKEYKVLCIDMDPQGNLSLLFKQDNPEHHILHLLINTVKELRALHTSVLPTEVLKESNGVSIIPCGQEMSGFELSVAGITAPRQLLLKRFLERSGLLDLFDYVVIDGPPTLGLITVNIVCAVHGLVIPFRPDQFSKMGLSHFRDMIDEIADMGITDAPKILGYLPNLVESRRKSEEEEFQVIRDALDSNLDEIPIFAAIPNRVQLFKSTQLGRSVFDYESKEYAPLRESFLSVATTIEESLQ